MRLLEIKSIPIEYKLKITNAELHLAEAEKERNDSYKNAEKAANQAEQATDKLNVGGSLVNVAAEKAVNNSKNSPKTDSEDKYFGNSGNENNDEVIRRLAEDGKDNNSQSKKATIQEQFNTKIQDEFQNRSSVPQFISNHQNILESTALNSIDKISKTVNNQRLEKVREAYNQSKRSLEYVPGNFEMEILTKPEVQVDYIGGFMYVPPEANPDYEEPFYEKYAAV
jgi:hypothetical protein